LFTDDFDSPMGSLPIPADVALPEPAPPEEADLQALLERRHAEGISEGREQVELEHSRSVDHLLAVLQESLASVADAAAARAELAAAAIGRLVVGLLTASFPASFEKFGPAEAVRFAEAILPDLTEEPAISITACPRSRPALLAAIARLSPDIRNLTTIAEASEMPPGGVRIAWAGGAAARDPAGLAARVADILAQFGLDVAAPNPPSLPELETIS
jgi:hypothetical protein